MAPKSSTTGTTAGSKTKASKKIPPAVIAETAPVAANPDLDAEEDDEEEMSASSGSSGPSLQKEESAAPMTTKNFRNHPDMENFFRFVFENDLRLEALEIVDNIIAERKEKKTKLL
jgi:hypothetical protein